MAGHLEQNRYLHHMHINHMVSVIKYATENNVLNAKVQCEAQCSVRCKQQVGKINMCLQHVVLWNYNTIDVPG